MRMAISGIAWRTVRCAADAAVGSCQANDLDAYKRRFDPSSFYSWLSASPRSIRTYTGALYTPLWRLRNGSASLSRGVAPCCTSCSIIHFQLLTFWVQSWSHYTVGKSSKFMCNTLVCIISFLAYALIIKYLRGRVEGIQAKKVPLRLAFINTPLFKCLFSPSHKRHSKMFCPVGYIHLEGLLRGFLNHQQQSPVDMYANKNSSDSNSKNWIL